MRTVKVCWVLLGLIGISGCSTSYRAMEAGEPHGYQSEQGAEGLQVSFTTWRGWSDQKLCDYASRRANEMVDNATLVGPVITQEDDQFTHVDSINAFVREHIDSGMQGDVSVMLTPDYVMARRVRTCTWTVSLNQD